MKIRNGKWAVVLLVLAAVSLRPPALANDSPVTRPASSTLENRVRKVIESGAFKHGHWGILVVDAKSGSTVYEQNADQLFAPASVTKLFSTAAALVELGPNHRFQTPVVRRGGLDSRGTLDGDLILIAQGDLCLGGRTGPDGTLLFKDDDHTYAGGNLRSEIVPSDPLAGLDHLAREVQAAGVKRVTRDVIIDDRLFEPALSTGSGPHRLSPIVINDNVVDVLVQPAGAAGEPALVSFLPATRFLTMDARVETATADQEPEITVKSLGPRRFMVRGKLPVGHARVVKILEVEEPASFARALFIEALRRRGVIVDASPLGTNETAGLGSRSEVAGLPKLAEYTSPPFREFIRVILKVSHNLHASTLPLLLAAKHGERSLQAGLKRQGEVLRTLGVDTGTISFGGGAGGSRADLVTPRATVALLRAVADRPDFTSFDAALPILGRDGTLARSVAPDSPARGHAHAKTGTYSVENDLTGMAVLTSKALAGYLETASGRQLVLAVFVNNVMLDAPKPKRSVSDATAEAGRLLGKLCEVFYASDADGSATAPARTSQSGSKDQERSPDSLK